MAREMTVPKQWRASKTVHRASKMRSDSRNEVLSVIEPRLRELMAKGTSGSLMRLTCTTNQVGRLRLELVQAPESGIIYVSVREGRKRHFTGYLDPEPPGKYLGGEVRVVTWLRGNWETRLLG